VTRTRRATVKQVLYSEVDVNTRPLASDLDPVCERRQGAVRPAAAAVCGDSVSSVESGA
jgi:hypothetical protein